jgi:hypothetical protein
MSSWYLIFLFAFALNLFVYFIAGLREVLIRGSAAIRFSTWLINGAMAMIWGWIAWAVGLAAGAIRGGSSLFIVFFAIAFLLLRGLLRLIGRGKYRRLWDAHGWRIDEAIKQPVILIPVLLIGYNRFDALTVLLVLIATWAGYGVALGVFALIRRRLDLENAEHRLKGSGVLLLSMAILAMLVVGIFQSFFPGLIL